jgi:protocatechuate 3,4-dioxygenase beta subunit
MTMREQMNRRAALEMFGAFGAAIVVGCGGSETSTTTGTGGSGGGSSSSTGGTGGTSTSSTTGTGSATCTTIPEETAGPYPDKTGMISKPAFFRKDVTEGKVGLPLALTLSVVDTSAGCAAVSGAVVEIWHCDALGVYSEYTGQPGVTTDESATTFLRGLQTSDASGDVSFTTIYPGWYGGRATHIHIEVFVNGASVKTTQLAFPDAITTGVYGSVAPYTTKGQNTLNNAADMVFSDGDEYQLATMTGDTTAGYTAALAIGIAL